MAGAATKIDAFSPTDLRTRVPVVHDGALLDDLVAEGEGEVGVVLVREVRCGRRDVDR